MKKNLLLYSSLTFLVATFDATAQQTTITLPNSVNISDITINRVGGNTYDGGMVWLNFEVSTQQNFSSRAILTVIPTLNGDNETYHFPSVKIMKTNALLMAERRGESFDPNTLLLTNKDVGGYSVGVPYETWMNGSQLYFENSVQYCQEWYSMPSELVASDIVLAEQVVEPLLVMAIPRQVTTIKEKKDCAFLNFKVASKVLNLDFAENAQEMAKIKQNIDNIVKDNNSIKKIELCGMSSPEGNYSFNQELAQNRANAVKNYLSTHYNYPEDMYSITYVAEDWKGLREEISNSSIRNKSHILAIIDDTSLTPTQRDAKMKTLSNYSFLLSEYYPRLRRVNYSIHYDSQQTKTYDEIVALYETSPETLSEADIYQVVKGCKPKGERYYKTVDNWAENLHPRSAVAQINKAVCDIERKHPRRARKALRCAANEMEIQGLAKAPEVAAIYFNTSGALELLEGDIEGAKILFRQAADMGLNEGVRNLSKLK